MFFRDIFPARARIQNQTADWLLGVTSRTKPEDIFAQLFTKLLECKTTYKLCIKQNI